MKINKLELVNFRNYKNLNLDFSSNKILIIGKNAQGKTNILESIYFTSSLKSLRAKTESELILWGQTFASIRLNFNKSDFDSKLELILSPPKKKILKVNDVKKNKYSDFISQLKTVNFQVDDLLLLRGTPENRRDWLDLAISQIYSAYYDRLSKYNKIRQQKVNYLKNSKLLTFDTSLFDVYNSQISIAGSNILFLRLKFLKEIIKFAQTTHNKIASGENLAIVYNSTVLGDIYIDDNYVAHIDKSKCVECGACSKVCPYNAISDHKRPCKNACKVDAISITDDYTACIDYSKCISCGACVYQCPFGAIMDKSYIVEAIEILKSNSTC